MDDNKTDPEIYWYCYNCKIIVTNGDMKLIDKEDKEVVNRFFFRLSVYGSLKTKKKSKTLSLKVSAAAYRNVRLRECENTEFV